MPNLVGSIFSCNECGVKTNDDKEDSDKKMRTSDKVRVLWTECNDIKYDVKELQKNVIKITADLNILTFKHDAIEDKQKEHHEDIEEIKEMQKTLSNISSSINVLNVKLETIEEKQKEHHNDMIDIKRDLREDIKSIKDFVIK